jgi:hypothetical protein
MNPNELYRYYLDAYTTPQSTDVGIQSIAPIASFQPRDTGIATLTPGTTGQMPTFFGVTADQYARNYINNPVNVFGTLASLTTGPIGGFLTTRAAMEAQRKGYLPQKFTDIFNGGSVGPSQGIGSFAESMAMAESVDGGFRDTDGPDASDTGYDSDDSGYGGGVTGGSFGE